MKKNASVDVASKYNLSVSTIHPVVSLRRTKVDGKTDLFFSVVMHISVFPNMSSSPDLKDVFAGFYCIIRSVVCSDVSYKALHI